MTWRNVADGTMPDEQAIVEVQLANGGIQLACFINGTWRIPAVDGLTRALSETAIKNAIKWRPFAEVVEAYRAKKVPFNSRPERWQP